MESDRKICVGQFAGAHGVRGLVKLRSFTADPEALFSYAPLTEKEGEREFKIVLKSSSKDLFIVAVEGIDTKDAADALRGDRIYIPLSILPGTGANEYYEAELIGLKAVDQAGKSFGRVIGVYDFGGGAMLEIGESKSKTFMLPFRDAFVPKVDIEAGTVEIALPEGWL